MSRRLWINAAAFLTLFAVLSVWAVRNVLHLDAIDRPQSITAEFETSPGLRSGFEVTYFGVHAGNLGRVAIEGDHVRATLKLDRGLDLPAELDAAVRRKSAVGEPYVDLTPTGGVDRGGPRLRPGTLIPRSRTSTPLSYAEVFEAVDDLVTGLPAGDLQRFLHSLAAGFRGRADDLRAAITGADQLTGTLVANAPLLEDLAGDLTTLTHTITEHRDAIGQGWDNLAALTGSLAQQTAHIEHLLDEGPTLTSQVDALLTAAGPDVGCIVDAAASLFSSVDDPTKIDQFTQLLDLAGPAADIVHTTSYLGPDGLYLNGVFIFSVADTGQVRYYSPPRTLGAAPVLRTCRGSRSTGPTTPAGPASGGETSAAPAESPARTPHRATPSSSVPDSSDKPVPAGRDLLTPVLWGAAAVVLGAVLVVRRRRAPETQDGDAPLEETPTP